MRNLILPLLFALLLNACGGGERSAQYPPGTVLEQKRGDNETVYYYPPPKAIDEGSARPKYQPTLPPTKIALLVPLSGQFKELGQNILDGAQLALFNLNDPSLKLLPFDTKGTPFGAVEATKEAILQDVKLILGPIFSQSAKAIAPVAAEHNLNFVSFSNDKSLAGTGAFAIGFLPEQQIKRVVEFAVSRGIEEFATVVPNNVYGGAAAKELRETIAENESLSVLKTEIYRLDSKGNPINLKNHVYSAFNALMKNKPPKDFDKELQAYNDNPIKYPRALLIPEGGESLKEVQDLLTKYNFDPEKIQLLGSDQWYKPEALNQPLLEGGWFATPPRESRARFENEFFQTYGYKPMQLVSLAYDGIALAATLSRISDGQDFSRQALTNPRGFIGVDGIFRLREDGLTDRGLAVMQIREGQFKVVEPAPHSFFEVIRHEMPKEELKDTEEDQVVPEQEYSPAVNRISAEEDGAGEQLKRPVVKSEPRQKFPSEQFFPPSEGQVTGSPITEDVPVDQELQDKRRPRNYEPLLEGGR